MGRLIVIEGLDLAGKSTLVTRLCAHLGRVRYSRNALCPENPIARLADELRGDPQRGRLEGGGLFLAAHEWDLRHFRRPGPHTVHLQDSCWLRALAFDQVLGSAELLPFWESSRDRWPRFDQVLYLTASLEERRRRYQTRPQNDAGDRMIFTAPRRFLALDRALRRACRELGALELDTTGLTADEVFGAALSRLHLRRAA